MEHKASLNTSFLKLSSTIQGRNPGKETTQHQRQMQSGGKWRKGNWNEQEWQKEKPQNTICTFEIKRSHGLSISRQSPLTSGQRRALSCRLQHVHKFILCLSFTPSTNNRKQSFPPTKLLQSSTDQSAQRTTASREKCSHFFFYIYRE